VRLRVLVVHLVGYSMPCSLSFAHNHHCRREAYAWRSHLESQYELIHVRIAHVITRLMQAGSEENTIATCRAQASAGHQVVLLHGNEWSARQIEKCGDGVEVREIRNLVHRLDPRKDLGAVLALRAFFLEWLPTVVHTHQSKAGVVGRIAAKLAKVPVIIHGVHIVPFINVSRAARTIYLAAERAVAGFTHAFINVSEGTRQCYLEHGVGRPETHFVAHSGFEVERFHGASVPDHWRALAGVPEGTTPPIVLMLAALEERKRHVEFVSAFARVVAKVPNVRLLLCGVGPTRERIEATIARLGLSDNVHLLGFQSRPEQWIALADLTVLTSMREGLPRVIVQSMAGGKPVVTTHLPGIAEIVTDGHNGIVTASDDLDATADVIAEVLLDHERLGRMKVAAASTDVSSWRVESMCSTMAEVYRELTRDPAPLGDRTCGR
jgi:glycosyltransferase involved in cell wall biosynthesis